MTVSRAGEQRAWRKMCQRLRVAAPCSPGARTLAWWRSNSFFLLPQLAVLAAAVGRADRAAGAEVSLVGVARDRPVGEGVDDAVDAGGGQVVGRAGQRR